MLVQSAPDVFSLAENGKGQTLATQSQAKQSGLEPGHDQTSSKLDRLPFSMFVHSVNEMQLRLFLMSPTHNILRPLLSHHSSVVMHYIALVLS
jgi:hypothetical protein